MKSIFLSVILMGLLFGEAFALDLSKTKAVNLHEIVESLSLIKKSKTDFKLKTNKQFEIKNPYYPSYQDKEDLGFASEEVINWYQDYEGDQSVCAVKFLDQKKEDYVLKTFSSKAMAEQQGYKITHYKPCGVCSPLKDLNVYLNTRDLTTPVRKCAKKMGLKNIKECLEEKVGFTPLCAEAWAYNSKHTKKRCMKTCIKEYGLLNLIRGDFSQSSHNNQDGSLSPCIECDEVMSGAGFKYSAGRTRRNSGITSAIQRGSGEIFQVEHVY